MSKLRLVEAMKRADIRTEITQVGDRYVIERMREQELNLGGEQSGHLIFSDYATTGDGIISALHVLKVMKQKNATLHDLAYGFMEEYPQKLVNIPVQKRIELEQIPQLNKVLADARASLGDTGRLIVRYSGTENKIRILSEAPDAAVMEKWSTLACDIIRKELM
jgi:phosphoglucosamine mutase